MRLKISLLLILAAALAFAAGLVSFIYLGEVDKELRASREAMASFGEIETVVVLGRDVKAGDVLQPEDFSPLLVPRRYLPDSAMTAVPEPIEGEALIALQDLGASELLFRDRIAFRPAGDAPAPPLRLIDGKAAGLFPIVNFAELRELLAPGMAVELFFFDQSAAKPVVRLLGSGFELLRLPVEPQAQTPQPMIAVSPALLLGAAPEDIARALLAAPSGELHLALSSGPRPVEAGQVVVMATELATLPIAVRAGMASTAGGMVHAGSTLPVEVRRESEPAASAVEFFGGGGGGCTTTVVRASQRQKIDVPC